MCKLMDGWRNSFWREGLTKGQIESRTAFTAVHTNTHALHLPNHRIRPHLHINLHAPSRNFHRPYRHQMPAPRQTARLLRHQLPMHRGHEHPRQ
jgi:hypothetical protein